MPPLTKLFRRLSSAAEVTVPCAKRNMPPQNNRMEPASITTNATQGLGGPDFFFLLLVRRRLLRCRVGSDEFDAFMLLLAAVVELAGRCFIVLRSMLEVCRIGISCAYASYLSIMEPVRTNTSCMCRVLNNGLKETRRFLKAGWKDRPNSNSAQHSASDD